MVTTSLLKTVVRLCCAGGVALSMSFQTMAQPANDRAKTIRAAMVFNFIRYSEWEKNTPAREVTLCVSRDSEIANELFGLRGRDINGRNLIVLNYNETSPESCHIAYLSAADAEEKQFAALHAAGVLTVSRTNESKEAGLIELVEIGRQTRFKVNNTLSHEAGVKFSSRLLRLALEVR